MEFFTHSAQETEEVGKTLAKIIEENKIIPSFFALYGDLGVGKTAFVRGFSSILAEGKTVKSPTYTIVNEYRGKNLSVFHFDMYRIEGEDDLASIGFEDYLANKKAICLCEWSEKIPFALPKDAIKVTIEKTDLAKENDRKITVEGLQ